MKRLASDPPVPVVNAANTSKAASGWHAQLALGFADDAGTTRLVERAHCGPLRVQKALYPEGPRVCHAIVVHPPGGAAGGDQLVLRVRAGSGSAALLTTPGAGKWYKANGRSASQSITIEAADGATVEWLPQETILFDAADVQLENTVVLGAGASYLGSEILCFGRTASGEAFRSGQLAQRTAIRAGGKLLWFEQGRMVAGSDAMRSPLGLAGKTVCATFIAVGKTVSPAVVAALREAAAGIKADGEAFGVTQMKTVTVARYLGDSSEKAKTLMTLAWRSLRPAVLEREAVIPRIWNT